MKSYEENRVKSVVCNLTTNQVWFFVDGIVMDHVMDRVSDRVSEDVRGLAWGSVAWNVEDQLREDLKCES